MTANELFNERKQKDKGVVLALVAFMLVLTFVAGALFGYNRFEANFIDTLNTQFESLGLGLCNTTPTYVQIDENATYWRVPKLNISS